MKLLRAHDVPAFDVQRTFRHSPWGAMFALVVFVACSAIPIFIVRQWNWPPLMYAIVGPIFLVGGLIWLLAISSTFNAVCCSFRSSNWVMKLASGGVYLKFRSYLNRHFAEEGPTVVYVPFRDVESVQEKFDTNEDARRGSQVSTRSLDILLKGVDTDELSEAVAAELGHMPRKKVCASRFHHAPVRVPEPGVIRVEWRSGMVKALSPHVRVLERRRGTHRLDVAADQAEIDARIIEMAGAGRLIDAVATARAHHKLSLTEARRYVDELARRGAPA